MVSIIVIGIISLFIIGLGFLILSGWGDSLIAGYNTASKEKQEKVNIKRLRYVVAGILFITAVMILVPSIIVEEDNAMATIVSAAVILIVTVTGVILANTWCIKK